MLTKARLQVQTWHAKCQRLMTSFTLETSKSRCKHSGGNSGKGGKKWDALLSGTNSEYLETLYNMWLQDKDAVDPSWNEFFQLIRGSSAYSDVQTNVMSKANMPIKITEQQDKTKGEEASKNLKPYAGIPSSGATTGGGYMYTSPRDSDDSYRSTERIVGGTLNIDSVIRAYQTRAHLIADVDPLGIQNPNSAKLQGTANLPPKIVVREHFKGITEADMEREFFLSKSTRIGGSRQSLPLKEIIMRLNKVYCGHVGLEYAYISDVAVLDWIREKFEVPNAWKLSEDHRKWIWKYIMKAVTFEGFLQKKYSSEKRFGLEGCEAFIPALGQVLETSAEKGVETVAIGMAHRGRLNTLANICVKPMQDLFTQFYPIALEGFGSGDVKYHLGTHSQRLLERSGKTIRVSILANPSHLEAINPSIVGRIRAEQVEQNDTREFKKSMPVLVHGDASFAGQGVCYETMHFTDLPEYTTGGVIHFIVNNQIGFTTDPRYSRSSVHCTDVAKVINAPIFHIHADDPDLVAYCSHVAAEFRAKFHNDVVLDIIGYRRYGHNELDEPMLTQPVMYKRIKQHPNVLSVYTQRLIADNVITTAFAKEETEKYLDHCETEFKKAKSIESMHMWDWHDIPWSDFFSKQNPKNLIPATGVDIDTVKHIFTSFSTPPDGITPHNVVLRAMDRRKKLLQDGIFDWAMGECLGFLSLLKDGHHVRLSGQDVERGTFSHRMHIVHDQNKDKLYKNILHGVFPNQALYTVSNSSLSEYGVSGFELGYSAYNYNTLTIWEGQFGDFANNCQVVIDSILLSGEMKWGRQLGLVMFLPHGLEGQGPEHSSARIERFLQLCDDDCVYMPGTEPNAPGNETVEEIMTRQLYNINCIVCNVTTPANLCHMLRRQILMPFRKPLVVMTPKSLLRHPEVLSKFEDVAPGTKFRPMLPDTLVRPEGIQKIIFCSGKVYYDVLKERREKKMEDKIAIIRIEQLCPFPYHLLIEEVARYPKCKLQWLQEEHKNQGAYYYIRERIALALNVPLEQISYAGRSVSAAPSTGNKIIHINEVEDMLLQAMEI